MFGRLFGKGSRSKSEPETFALASGIRDAILTTVGSGSIPTMPAAAQKAFQLSTDPRADARDFVEVIEADEGLSARVIKIANSVYFDRGKTSSTIEESVTVIGINELRCLLNATTLAEIFPSRHVFRAQAWANDIATAIIARNLARRFVPSKDEIAFLGGLMHDIGKLLLLQRSGDDYGRVLKIVEERGVPFCEAEEEVYVFNHTEAGQLVGQRWNFSAELNLIIRTHHNSFEEAGDRFSLPNLVKAADTVAHSLGLGHGRGFTRFRNRAIENLPAVWEMLGIRGGEQKELLANCERAFNSEYDLYVSKTVRQN